MNLTLGLFLAFLGLVLGSFIAAAIFRLRNKTGGLITGRSFCANCKTTLRPVDLIPLVSFVMLSGKCRYCNKPIPRSCLWIEILTAVIFVCLGLVIGQEDIFLLAWHLFFSSVLVFLAAYDWLYGEIPDEISLPAIGLALLGSSFGLGAGLDFFSALLGFGVGALAFFALFFFSNGKWMGGGDARLVGLLGALLGWKLLLVAVFFAALSGSVVGLSLIVRNKKKFTSTIPFGPCLVLGGFFALLFGDFCWSWYVDRFLF